MFPFYGTLLLLCVDTVYFMNCFVEEYATSIQMMMCHFLLRVILRGGDVDMPLGEIRIGSCRHMQCCELCYVRSLVEEL
jgi:hypothetical protein